MLLPQWEKRYSSGWRFAAKTFLRATKVDKRSSNISEAFDMLE
ncbi:hypothetical protein HAL1_16611 [Halomonas sp. HAL1]|nr:hypothetical protein HAL1_16611 [Halomonas sp. HAL1]